MGVLMIPDYDPEIPTLGPQLVDWMQTFLVHGPGDVRGRPYALDAEKQGVVYRMYEIYPQGHPRAGRRMRKRVGLSVRKGWAKTELGAAIAAGELHPDAPVRFSHWAEAGEVSHWGYEYAEGEPVGIGVRDPYIPMVAYTEEQSEELAYGCLLVMLSEGPLAEDFDIGLSRIIVLDEGGRAAGKAVALAAAPDSRDGARTTFQLFDETHRQDSDRLRHAHETMLANIPKRLGADAWSLEVTTAYEPGRLSIAEKTHNYAKLVAEGKIEDELIFFYHREAGAHHNLATRDGMMAAVLEASGPAAAFTDVDYIVSLGMDPQVDPTYWERVWLNRITASSSQFFPIHKIAERVIPAPDEQLWTPERGALVTLGFDGAKTRDGTGIVVTDIERKAQAVVAYWEVPRDRQGRPDPDWEVPAAEVNEAMEDAFERWDVVFLYADPYWWEDDVKAWTGKYGHRRVAKRRVQRVVEWPTNSPRKMALSLAAYRNSMRGGAMSWSGDERLKTHWANARKNDTGLVDEDGQPLPTIRKERPDSPNLMDLAMAGCLSWEAMSDAVALGAKKSSRTLHAY